MLLQRDAGDSDGKAAVGHCARRYRLLSGRASVDSTKPHHTLGGEQPFLTRPHIGLRAPLLTFDMFDIFEKIEVKIRRETATNEPSQHPPPPPIACCVLLDMGEKRAQTSQLSHFSNNATSHMRRRFRSFFAAASNLRHARRTHSCWSSILALRGPTNLCGRPLTAWPSGTLAASCQE